LQIILAEENVEGFKGTDVIPREQANGLKLLKDMYKKIKGRVHNKEHKTAYYNSRRRRIRMNLNLPKC
jgi:hypothetical protein